MNQTLYRKYRPHTFDDVVGQETIVSILRESIANNTVSHAYLFSGTRGTGKTSIARIFARELGTSEQDIYELDAASHTGVDNIRELRSGVSTRPFNSPYKVYIIDEAHMLSTAAANALLKTLEEPPAHAIFILATTEKHKILDTIKSRCVVFDFESPQVDDLVPFIQSIAKRESLNLSPESIELIAKQGVGSYRDTLSALQKLIGQELSAEEIEKQFISTHRAQAVGFVEHIVREPRALIADLEALQKQAIDPKRFVDDVLDVLRESLRVTHGNSSGESIEGVSTRHLKDCIDLRQDMESSINPLLNLELYIYSLTEESA